jgi:hypothetical protein
MAAIIFASVLAILTVSFLAGLIMWMINFLVLDEESPFYWFTRKKDPTKVFLDFDVFIRFKKMNPDKWEWGECDYVKYCHSHHNYTVYMSTFIDYIKLVVARRNKIKYDKLERQGQKEHIEFLAKLWMEDIENFKRNGGNE